MRKQRTLIAALVIAGMLLVSPCIGFPESQQDAGKGFEGTEALIELLKEKGVITEKEAERFVDRYRTNERRQPSQVITIVPREQSDEMVTRMTRQVTDQVTNDLQNVQQDLDGMSEELLRRSRLQEKKIEDLERVLKDDHGTKLFNSSWAQRIRFGGDVRLRHRRDFYAKDNARFVPKVGSLTEYKDITNDNQVSQVRARLGVVAQITDPRDTNVGKVETGLRVATGSLTNPVSTNYTIDNTSQSRSDIVLDLAYIKWAYEPLEPPWGESIPKVTLSGGIFQNPWFHTNLVWDGDLSFGGVAADFRSDTLQQNPFKAFLTVGYFPLESYQYTHDDKYLIAGQVGFSHQATFDLGYQIGVAFYDYKNVTAEIVDVNTVGPTTASEKLARNKPKFTQQGNTTFITNPTAAGLPGSAVLGLAGEYRLLNLTAKMDYTAFFPITITFWGDYVNNIGWDPAEVARLTGTTIDLVKDYSGNIGYQLGFRVGYPRPRSFGEWNTSIFYRYLESDSVYAAFTDSDFHDGGTNAKGWGLGTEVGLYKDVWLNARWMSTQEITDVELIDLQDEDYAVDHFFIDVNAEF
ncbi:MAG: putative porin [Pseudomonadota bacterium]